MQISIILPTFNRSKILKETINNIQNQTFKNYELIIINDSSTDDTLSVIERFQKKDSRIIIINNPHNLGCASSRKIGLQYCNNELIVFIDDDDQWDNEKLMQQYNAMINNDSNMVISDYYILKKRNKTYQKMNLFAQNFKNEILKKPGPFFQCIMIKKELIKLIDDPFDTQSIPSEDWNFFIELSKLNPKIHYINKPLFTWKIHNNNQSLNLNKEAKALEYIVNKHYNYINVEHGVAMIANHYRRIARVYEKNLDLNNIKRLYIKAFKINPFSFKNCFYYLAVLVGYKNIKFLIYFIRKIRGVQNV
jgi:teichuronic acid biosynthesis glycosyltransferase TuaG